MLDAVSIEALVFSGETTLADGSTRIGCGGYAPQAYALKQGYDDCREDADGALYRPPRYSSQDALLFDFAHVSGNP